MTRFPVNPAANTIVQAESVIKDLGVQLQEIEDAIRRQQDIVDSLSSIAEWSEEPPETPQPPA